MITKRHKIMISVAIACLLSAMLCLFCFRGLNEKDTAQTAARRWQAGSQDFTQLSVFFSNQENWTLNDRKALASRIRTSFQENSILNEGQSGSTEGLFKDCYSCETRLTLTNGKKTAEAVVTATGGDFFYFHPQVWLSGYAYSEADAMQDRIVLDKELAWNLFGSSHVEGMSLKVGENTFYVAGVVDISKDSDEKAAYGEKHRAWISFAALEAETGEAPAITAYEAVMPEPVNGWAKEILITALLAEEREIVVLENSSRSEILQVYRDMLHFSEKMMVTKEVRYPYWENAARMRDCKRVFSLAFATLFLIYPCILGGMGITALYRALGRKISIYVRRFLDRT